MKAAIFKNLRIIILPLCLLLCIGMLSGCGKKEDNSRVTSAAGTGTELTEQKEEANQKETAGTTENLTEMDTEAPGQTKEPTEFSIPGDFPMSFTFSSGAGGWRTWLTLYADGTFEGEYSDSEMGDTGEGYPNGSYYIAVFAGKFGNIKKVDEFSYSMELDEITLEREPGTEWIEDEIRYVAAEAYGLDGGEAFVLYTPETPVERLSENFLGWWSGRFADSVTETLSCYGIYNKAEETGFFTD